MSRRKIGFLLSIFKLLLASMAFAGCNIISGKDLVFKVPNLPERLHFLEPQISWKVRGSILPETVVQSGTIIHISQALHPNGDWVLAEPLIDSSYITGFNEKSVMPVYGWFSACLLDCNGRQEILLDKAGGLGAFLLEKIPSQLWAGFNLGKFGEILRNKNLDTINADYERLLLSAGARKISIYDFVAREKYEVANTFPEGTWVDIYGTAISGSSEIELEPRLFIGINHLFREADGAILRVSVQKQPDGRTVVYSILHEPCRLPN